MNSNAIDHQQAIKNMMAERYLLGELSENERDAYEAHLFDCQICFAQVKAGTEFVGYLKRVGTEEPVAVPVAKTPWRQFLAFFSRPLLAPAFAILFLGFASLSAYQSLVIQQLKEPQVIATATLKETPRGDETNLVTARRNSMFPLHLVLTTSPDYTSYEGQISQDTGDHSAANSDKNKGNHVLKTFFISEKDAQEPLTVSLYSGNLAEGDYVLEVLGVKEGSNKTSIATYNFKLRFQK
jgi:hypothetical protein